MNYPCTGVNEGCKYNDSLLVGGYHEKDKVWLWLWEGI